MILLFSHVRTGRWASVMPAKLAETLGLTDTLRAIPIIEPEAVQTIGLVVPAREPMMPMTAALVEEAQTARAEAGCMSGACCVPKRLCKICGRPFAICLPRPSVWIFPQGQA